MPTNEPATVWTSFNKRPTPTLYQFLIDEFYLHHTNANLARSAQDKAKFLDELQQAYDALNDFKTLLNEV